MEWGPGTGVEKRELVAALGSKSEEGKKPHTYAHTHILTFSPKVLCE